MKTDSVAQSVTTGRLLGSLIMTILAGYLATEGIDLTEENNELAIKFIEMAFVSLGAAVPGIISKIREVKRAK